MNLNNKSPSLNNCNQFQMIPGKKPQKRDRRNRNNSAKLSNAIQLLNLYFTFIPVNVQFGFYTEMTKRNGIEFLYTWFILLICCWRIQHSSIDDKKETIITTTKSQTSTNIGSRNKCEGTPFSSSVNIVPGCVGIWSGGHEKGVAKSYTIRHIWRTIEERH